MIFPVRSSSVAARRGSLVLMASVLMANVLSSCAHSSTTPTRGHIETSFSKGAGRGAGRRTAAVNNAANCPPLRRAALTMAHAGALTIPIVHTTARGTGQNAIPITVFAVDADRGALDPMLQGSFLYFHDQVGGLWRASADGQGQSERIAQGIDLFKLLVGDTLVHPVHCVLYATTLSNGRTLPIATETEDIIHLASNGQDVFYTRFDRERPRRASLTTGHAHAIGVVGTQQAVVADSQYVYVSTYHPGTIYRVDLATEQTTVLARDQDKVTSLEMDRDSLFYYSEGTMTVRRLAKSGGTATVIATNVDNADSLAVDDTHVYYPSWDPGDQKLMRVRKDGTSPPQIVLHNTVVDTVVVDQTAVYIRDQHNRGIVRIAKADIPRSAEVTMPRENFTLWRPM